LEVVEVMNGVGELSGRALDAEVARRVFGFGIEWRTNKAHRR
jgi:hypothetical protein